MAGLISLRETGKLHSWITHQDKPGESQSPKKEMSKGKEPAKDAGTWLHVGLPALYAPHENRPWVQAL